VIHAAKFARLLDDSDVLRLLDDANQALIARGARSVLARIGVGDVVSVRTVGDAFLHVTNGSNQKFGLPRWMPEGKEGPTLRANCRMSSCR
jgi:hypothetical protein